MVRKLIFTLGLGLASLTTFGQKTLRTPDLTVENNYQFKVNTSFQSGTETPLWTEDFSNGIGAWTNSGISSNCLWEYRGASTNPSVTTGGRGYYDNGRNISSLSQSNGFVIFDSDYRDNGGSAGLFGTGVSAALPHTANLISPTIDLSTVSSSTALELIFWNSGRLLWGPGSTGSPPSANNTNPSTFVSFSSDGGTTWSTPINCNQSNGPNVAFDEQNVISIPTGYAGSNSVKIKFTFDGAYYTWMIDDISISTRPANRLTFTATPTAPKFDIIYGPANFSSKMGILTSKQTRGISFDCNAYNTGASSQSNIKLQMRIYSQGSLVQTVNSSTLTSLSSGDTADYNDLNTYSLAWTPNSIGNYAFVYEVMSDSTSVLSDTTYLFVTDSLMSLDFNSWDNSIGASSSTNTGTWGDGSSVAMRFDLVDDELLFGSKVYLSSDAQAGAILEFSVYDSSAWQGYSSGFNTGSIVAYKQHVVDAGDVSRGFVRFDLTDPVSGRGVDLMLSNGAYYYVVTMYDNQGQNKIRLRNDQTFGAVTGSRLMYIASAASWYSGYSGGSRSFNNIWIRGIHCPASSAAACMGIGVDEEALEQIVMSPNPASEFINLDFGMAVGDYNVAIVDLTGKVMKSEVVRADANVSIFIGDLNAGMYMVRVQKGNDVKTMKLSVL